VIKSVLINEQSESRDAGLLQIPKSEIKLDHEMGNTIFFDSIYNNLLCTNLFLKLEKNRTSVQSNRRGGLGRRGSRDHLPPCPIRMQAFFATVA